MRKLPKLDVEDQIYYFFSAGLRSVQAKREIAFRKPATLDEAIHIADTSEQLYLGTQNRFRNANHNPVLPWNNIRFQEESKAD
jgi:hypothetical protein